jgi:Rps23 Pro-64 3,4-dihydroxylase Tpa1-like proline 4-hydroxylase
MTEAPLLRRRHQGHSFDKPRAADVMVNSSSSYVIAAASSAAANRFSRATNRNRARFPGFLRAEDADRLLSSLQKLDRWNVVTTSRGRHLDLDARGLAAFSDEDRSKFNEAVFAPATRGFQYLFENYPIYDAYYAGTIPDPEISAFFEFLNSEPMLNFARQVTGVEDIAFADAQATRYRAGHFLTGHSDGVEGKNRAAAYVFNLTRDWRPDWGGILNFVGPDGHIEEGFTPTFNALNMFAVPQEHHVSVVAPYAGSERISVTGWFRTGVDPMRAKG